MRPWWCPGGALVVVWWWQDLHSPFNILSLVQQWITNKQLKVKEKEMFKSLQVAISWWGGAVVVGGGEISTKPPWELQFLIIFVTAALNMDFLKVSYSLPSALPSIEEEFLPRGTKAPQLSQFLFIFKRSPQSGPLLAASYSLFSGPLQELGYLINVKKKA